MGVKKNTRGKNAGKGMDAEDTRDNPPEMKRGLAELYLNLAGTMMVALDRSGRISMINRKGCEILGVNARAAVGMDWFEHFIPDKLRDQVRDVFHALMEGERQFPEYQENLILTRKSGERLIAWHNTVIRDDDGNIKGTLSAGEDLTEQREADDALKESQQLYQKFINANRDLVFVKDEELRYVVANDAIVAFFGRSRQKLLNCTDFDLMDPTAAEICRKSDLRALEERKVILSEENIYQRIYEATKFPLTLKGGHIGVGGILRDITERRQAEEERERMQQQMIQAQKMESIGRLAGGVAHDFNNILSVILGHAEMAMDRIDPANPLHTDLAEIRRAARSSADLTRQLLAFARRQTILPRVLDLNETVAGMHKMLERLIGENIEFAWKPGNDIWPVHIDPAQVDQILANLCVNARDAIPDSGRISISTENITIADESLNRHAGFHPGQYVRLTISDDGCGMDRETLAKAFEPFFTTKVLGVGTGLGLSTVYGIVKQNGGFIHAYSEPGHGTTFRIYLPSHSGDSVTTRPDSNSVTVRGGGETILLVEDEPAILKLGKRMLQRLGYQVLTAGTPAEAQRVSDEFSGEIHLLVSDVIMPGMNGSELAAILTGKRPLMKTLFMSGYTADVIANQNVLHGEVSFMQKPFTIRDLALQVRDALER